jgi:hypothetical protein
MAARLIDRFRVKPYDADLSRSIAREHGLDWAFARQQESGRIALLAPGAFAASLSLWERSDLSLRRGDWIQTYSGLPFWPHDPQPQDIDIEDIAQHLSRIERWNGAARQSWTVARHSMLVHEIVRESLPTVFGQDPEIQLQDFKCRLVALLHDAPEFSIGDMNRPTKDGCPDFRMTEAGVWLAVCQRFDIPDRIPGVVRIADDMALDVERSMLLGGDILGRPSTHSKFAYDSLMYGLRHRHDPQRTAATFIEHVESLLVSIESLRSVVAPEVFHRYTFAGSSADSIKVQPGRDNA